MKNRNVNKLGDETASAYNFVGGMSNYHRAPHASCEITGAKKPGMS
jgi:hypothetical protein